jgi:hypothetical protein
LCCILPATLPAEAAGGKNIAKVLKKAMKADKPELEGVLRRRSLLSHPIHEGL